MTLAIESLWERRGADDRLWRARYFRSSEGPASEQNCNEALLV
jgi:hypothetical protein